MQGETPIQNQQQAQDATNTPPNFLKSSQNHKTSDASTGSWHSKNWFQKLTTFFTAFLWPLKFFWDFFYKPFSIAANTTPEKKSKGEIQVRKDNKISIEKEVSNTNGFSSNVVNEANAHAVLPQPTVPSLEQTPSTSQATTNRTPAVHL